MTSISKVRRPRSVGWLSTANLWTITGLALTAIASLWVATRPAPATPAVELTQTVAGESTTAPVDERIELAQVGTAVWSHNPSGEEDLTFGDKVDPATWKHLVLRSHKKDGSACEINLLRPDWWVEEEAAEKGGTVYVSVPECGIDGDAEVLEIRPCPPIQECPLGYRTITGTFHHQNAKVIDLYIEGLAEPIGTTPNHLFWSVDRKEFVRADSLGDGELVLLLDGSQRVRLLAARVGRHEVFNLEVLSAHTFCVGRGGLLVHNTKPECQFRTGIGLYVRKVDGYKHALDIDHVKAARIEKGGGVVALKSNGVPFDHLGETRMAMNGLYDRIPVLHKALGDGSLTPAQRAAIEAELGEISRLLDRAENILGELAGSVR